MPGVGLPDQRAVGGVDGVLVAVPGSDVGGGADDARRGGDGAAGLVGPVHRQVRRARDAERRVGGGRRPGRVLQVCRPVLGCGRRRRRGGTAVADRPRPRARERARPSRTVAAESAQPGDHVARIDAVLRSGREADVVERGRAERRCVVRALEQPDRRRERDRQCLGQHAGPGDCRHSDR